MADEAFEEMTVEGRGVTVPLLIWRRFHKEMPGLLGRVYEANPGLADLGEFLPLGTVVLMPIPAPKKTPVTKPVRLWE